MSGAGRKTKIEIKKIEKESSRMVTFSKRRRGLVKKAVELEDKTGARVALVVFSPRNRAYTYCDIPSMSEVVERMITTSSNNRILPYAAQAVVSSGSNYKNLMRWVDSIDADECHGLEETLKLEQVLECLLGKNDDDLFGY